MSNFTGGAYASYFEDDELEDILPPYHTYVKYMKEDNLWVDDTYDLRRLIGLEKTNLFAPMLDTYMHIHVNKMLSQGYDYQNLYDPTCDTAIYYFLEEIVLDFDDMEEDEEYYPYGWVDTYQIFAKMGIRFPDFGDGGKYGRSLHWE